MFNTEKPSLEELPSSAQLLRSTVVAALAALALLVAVVLPAEYGIDPTGAGRVLGLTEMGEIKRELADEAEADRPIHGAEGSSNVLESILGALVGTAHAQESWRETIMLTLEPGEATEVKFIMAEGDVAEYAWVAEGGRINFDLHAHGGGQSIDYDRGRGEREGEGRIEAPFAGEHGWFWRNRDDADVTVTLRLRGDYAALVRSD